MVYLLPRKSHHFFLYLLVSYIYKGQEEKGMKCFEIGKEYHSNDFIIVPLQRIVNSRGKARMKVNLRRYNESEEEGKIEIFPLGNDREIETTEFCHACDCWNNKYMTVFYALEVAHG